APVVGVHVEEVADVVPAVAKRGGVKGQHPDAVDAQPFDVVEFLAQALEITGAVVVRVVEDADQDLVEDGMLEPTDRGIEGPFPRAHRNRRQAHRPKKVALPAPCAAKEAIPRDASSVRATAAKASCSVASPSASVPSRPRSMAHFASPCATRGPRANSAAHASADASTSSGATTRFTSPMASASPAGTWRPVMMRS